MSDDLEAAAHYRQHADELRVIAETVLSEEIRKTLLRIASDYERIAKSRETIDATKITLGGRFSEHIAFCGAFPVPSANLGLSLL